MLDMVLGFRFSKFLGTIDFMKLFPGEDTVMGRGQW